MEALDLHNFTRCFCNFAECGNTGGLVGDRKKKIHAGSFNCLHMRQRVSLHALLHAYLLSVFMFFFSVPENMLPLNVLQGLQRSTLGTGRCLLSHKHRETGSPTLGINAGAEGLNQQLSE